MAFTLQTVKAEKRRVGTGGRHRESRQVEGDAEEGSEHGLGAAHRPGRKQNGRSRKK